MDYTAVARKYQRDVVSGKVPACEFVRLACQRQADDVARWGSKSGDYYFDAVAANRVCAFVELIPHIKGEWANRGETIKLEPWQIFILTTVFGWMRRDGSRRFRTVFIEVPRKNGKSMISSAVALYMLLMDGESGANVYSAATTKDQARIVFDAAQEMTRRTPELREATGAQVLAHAIVCERTGSKLQPLSSERDSLDGLNMHCGIIDELHAHKSRAVFDVLETATGSRWQPLLWVITTAGSNRAGVCYEQRTYVTRILQKVLRDESYFGIVYSIDDGDSWTDPATWAKANPNLGVSIYRDDIARLCAKAVEVASAQNTFLTKRLNVWVSSHTAWMNMIDWAACGAEPVSLDDFAGEECWIGVDLATKIDVAAVSILFRRDKQYYAFGKYYLPEDAVAERARTVSSHYDGWAREGRFTLTPGNVTDFEFIRDDILLMASKFQVKAVAYDPWQATQFAGELMADGAPMVEFRQTVANISEPMKQLEALVKSRRLEHGGCPVLAWMASNVVAHLDAKENIYPRKERPENKIDGIVALIMALGVAMIQTQSNILSSDEIIARMGDVI